ncbi:PfkB family carbohydrate kinase [Martelella alba]|uniref:Ribokinase n=1 Tax=Martelella alba TaxID=2590451 RepID=A0ABY2SJJ7_9HYPH|nr:ribokinase [Martelella alba]TKI05184.1 DeoR family transcriptional regulator [Martelella alba]
MYMKQRREIILDYIKAHDWVSVDSLAALFSVSGRTIRSDLTYLASFGLVQRVHGGVIFTHHALLTQLAGNNQDLSKILRSNGDREDNNAADLVDRVRPKKSRGGKVCILGTFFVDIITKVDHLPIKGGELLPASDISFGPGGKGANQALAAAAAGAAVHFVAKVGTDQFGKMAYDHLVASGIESFMLYQTPDAATGCSTIYVSQEQGESIIAIHPGANKKLTEPEITAMHEKISAADIFLLHTGNNIDAIAGALKLANLLNVPVVLNPAPFTEEIRPYLSRVDIIIPNAHAASRLSGMDINGLSDAKAAARTIYSLGVKTVIITLGESGALLFCNSTFYHFPAYPSVKVDTTGAGDAFCGAFCAMMAQGGDVFYAMNYASAFASLVIEKEGAATMPVQDEVRHRLKDVPVLP